MSVPVCINKYVLRHKHSIIDKFLRDLGEIQTLEHVYYFFRYWIIIESSFVGQLIQIHFPGNLVSVLCYFDLLYLFLNIPFMKLL